MKKLATAIAIAGLIGTPALAADMAVKGPPVAPAPVFSWTGFYGGLNMGVGLGRASNDINYFAPALQGGPCNPSLCINGSDRVHMNGPIGGVQVGYNWQNGNYLLGLEADFQGTGQSGTRDFVVSFDNGTTGQGTAGISITERMPWFGTLRGRVGYVANPWLVYVTGGLAYGRIEIDSSASATGIPNVPPTLCTIAVGNTCSVWGFSGSGVTKMGWTVGLGTELALGGNWTAKFEYLFVDLGSFNTTFTGLAGCFATPGQACRSTAAGAGTIHSAITENIARVGLNYQFH
jgi:outer membrane immunogenic protein